MMSLDEAWRWYENTFRYLKLMGRLGRGYWDALPWQQGLERDDHFRLLDGENVSGEVDHCLTFLDDLAVVVLFSEFESRVRAHVLMEIEDEVKALTHPVLRLAAEDVRTKIDEGSFFQVLQPYKERHADLVEQVNQVRRYRNWVAHGKREEPPDAVNPKTAYERLSRFLSVLIPTTATEPTP